MPNDRGDSLDELVASPRVPILVGLIPLAARRRDMVRRNEEEAAEE